MTREERNIESKLLSQRWNLIQQGIDCKSIRIHCNQLLVDNQLHGQIIISEYVRPIHKNQDDNSSTSESHMPTVPEQTEHDNANE